MKPLTFMLIAGEASGDLLAAELVKALRAKLAESDARPTSDRQPLPTGLAPQFFGAGGPRLAAAGVELAFDLTAHSVFGLTEALKHYGKFKRLFDQLVRLARERQPDAIICVDFSGFNRRFARAIKRHVRARSGPFHNWNPKMIQYVSPQVWASRAGRARQLARDVDLLLSIFPFEKPWYAARAPKLRVEFVGHPMADRFTICELRAASWKSESASIVNRESQILLLPGSRMQELRRHLPVMLGAWKLIRVQEPQLRAKMVLPDESLAQLARLSGIPADVEIQIGDLPQALAEADVAIASTGTVTLECACFGVPTVAIYKTSWATWEIAKRIVQVKHAAMPNLLAGETIYPELIQNAATPENIARAALELLANDARRREVQAKLARVIASLGGPGASARAAEAVLGLF